MKTHEAVALALIPMLAQPLVAQAGGKQHAVVVFDHRGGNSPRVSSQVDDKVTRGGLTLVRVPTGENACFVVERANTLLYGYSLDPEALKGQMSADEGSLAAALAKSIAAIQAPTDSAAKVAAVAAQATATDVAVKKRLDMFLVSPSRFVANVEGGRKVFQADSFTSGLNANQLPGARVVSDDLVAGLRADDEAKRANAYTAGLKNLAQTVVELEELRATSALDTNLVPTAKRSKELHAKAQAQAHSLEADYSDESTPVFAVLRGTSKELLDRASKLHSDYMSAATNNRREFCHTLQDARVKLHLVIAKKAPSGTSTKPDTVASFIAEPENEKNFELVPALAASFAISGEKSFEVEGNAVRQVETRPKFVPSAFMMWRIADRRPYWAAVGTAPGRGKTPDTHLGLVLRLGEEKLHTSLVLGAGLVFAHTAVGLDGASVGGPLPEGKKLTDVTRFGYRWGPTVFLTISGLSISVGDKTVAASPDAKK